MFRFVLDLGTILNIFLLLLYLIIVVSFQYAKIGPFGLKRIICMKSEEIWHKVHVAASYATIPFVLISIVLIFINNMWFNIALGSILLLLLPRVWDIVVKSVIKKDTIEFREKEQKELEEQIKIESGWKQYYVI